MSKDVDKLIAEAESLKIQELKADNLKLLKQLDRAKNKKADLKFHALNQLLIN